MKEGIRTTGVAAFGAAVVVAYCVLLLVVITNDIEYDDRLDRLEQRLEQTQVPACAEFLTERFDAGMVGVESELAGTGHGPGLAEMAPALRDLDDLVGWAQRGLLESEIATSRFERFVRYFQARGEEDKEWQEKALPRLQGMVSAIPSRN